MPPDVCGELSALWVNIQAVAAALGEEILALLDRRMDKDPTLVALEIGIARNAADARRLGLPAVGAHGAAIALAVSRLPGGFEIVVEPRQPNPGNRRHNVRLVPRGARGQDIVGGVTVVDGPMH